MKNKYQFQAGEIILFTPFIGALGGVERLILGLSATLHSVGRSHRVVCFEDTTDLASHANWPIIIEQLRPPRSPLFEARALQGWLSAANRAGVATPLLFDLRSAFYAGLAELPPFVLHLTDPPSLLPTDGSKMSFSARRRYKPFSSLPRPSLPIAMYGELVHRLNRRGARSASKVVSMTQRIAEELQHLYSVKSEIIRPGVSIPQTADRYAQKRELRFLSVSRLEQSKRIDWILNALIRLEMSQTPLSGRADWQLHIVGHGSQRKKLEALAAASSIQDRVIFHGLVSDHQLEQLYSNSDLFLMPAVQGYGLPALEALARNVPIILHRDSGVAEILQHTKWAEIIDSDYLDLARALSLMVDRLQNRDLETIPRPTILTERQWSLQIGRSCGWNLTNDQETERLAL
jgi:glycosyltransferase involved in cell wall biosynthesis